LKVLLSLGGWGGCGPCSEVFSTKNGRAEFARSVKQLLDGTHTDGLLQHRGSENCKIIDYRTKPSKIAYSQTNLYFYRTTIGRK
jgi:hypothetical protein